MQILRTIRICSVLSAGPCALFFAVSLAHAETCLSAGSFDWPTVEAGAWEGCAPSADDDFTIRSGDVVRVTGDISQLDGPAGITNFGRLEAAVEEEVLTVRVGWGGYTEALGGETVLTGGCREFGDPGGDTAPGDVRAPCPLTADHADALWRVGIARICPAWDAERAWWTSDCGGHLSDSQANDHTWGFHYPEQAFEADFSLSIDRIQADEEIAVRDLDPTDRSAPAESGFYFDIAEAEGSGGQGRDAGLARIHVDMRQGSIDTGSLDPLGHEVTFQTGLAGYGFDTRDILQTTLRETQKGSRLVQLPADAIDEDERRNGQWLVFREGEAPCPGEASYPGGAPCVPEATAFRIMQTRNDVPCAESSAEVCDVVVLAGLRNLPTDRDHEAGETVWITPVFFAPGDPFFVRVPVELASSRAGTGADPAPKQRVTFNGTSDLENVTVDTFRSNNNAFGNDARMARAAWIWWRDLGGGGNEKVGIKAVRGGVTPLIGWSFTGGFSELQELNQQDHCLDIEGEFDWRIEDFASRHCGDDFIVMNEGAAPPSLTGNRIRCEFSNSLGIPASQECVAAPSSVLHLTDGMCVNCTPDDSGFTSNSEEQGTLRNALILASNSRGIGFGNLHRTGLTVIGVLETSLAGALIGVGEIDGCVIRESGMVGGNPNNGLVTTSSAFGQNSISVKHCLFRDTRSSGTVPAVFCNTSSNTDHHCVFEDNAVVNHHRLGGPQSILFDARSFSGLGEQTLSIRNNIFAYTPDQDEPGETAPDGTTTVGAESGLVFDLAGAGEEDSLVMGGNLFAGFRRGGGAYRQDGGELDRPDYAPEGWCFFGNEIDVDSQSLDPDEILATLATRSAGVVRDEPGALTDPAAGDFRPLAGSAAAQVGCGPVEPVGVCEPLWYHAINNLEPECLASACGDGVDNDGDGLVDLEDPACSESDDISEQSPDFLCDDGLDNDGDGLIDFPEDPGCIHPAAGAEDPACDNGLDDDGDGRIDLDDPDCSAPWRFSEMSSRCGVGAELAILVPILFFIRQLARKHG